MLTWGKQREKPRARQVLLGLFTRNAYFIGHFGGSCECRRAINLTRRNQVETVVDMLRPEARLTNLTDPA